MASLVKDLPKPALNLWKKLCSPGSMLVWKWAALTEDLGGGAQERSHRPASQAIGRHLSGADNMAPVSPHWPPLARTVGPG